MEKINKPNLNGPRFREKRISILKRKKLEMFKSQHPEYSNLTLNNSKV